MLRADIQLKRNKKNKIGKFEQNRALQQKKEQKRKKEKKIENYMKITNK